ncbi:MAG: LPS assembly protein LptD, partial [Candidatus Omnitrophica bacterium]|nr:LPS assembly protein LptD [Candidatus Omnitrophota bacterium]
MNFFRLKSNTYSLSSILEPLLIILISFSVFNDAAFCQGNTLVKDKSETAISKPIVVDADNVECFDSGSMIKGAGNVKIDYDNVILEADNIEVDLKTNEALATGRVRVFYNNIKIIGDKLDYNFQSKKGRMLQDQGEGGSLVEVTHSDIRITAKQIDFNLEERIAAAPGDIKIERGQSVSWGKDLAYDFTKESGSFKDITYFSPLWYGKAQDGEKADMQKYVLNRAYMTTCDKDKPHYRVQAKRFYVYPGDKIVAKNVVIFIGNVPVMYLPYWKQSFESDYIISLSVGRKKDWGWFALSSIRYYLNENLKTTVHFDQRDLKGTAGGADFDYDTKNFGKGTIKAYHMNERDKYYRSEDDPRTRNAQETERWRVKLTHRWEIDSSTLAMFESHELSDIFITKDYLYKEYEDDIQPASEGYITHYEDGYSLSLYGRKRTNRFYSEVERLPEFTLNTVSREILDSNLYFRQDIEIANLNKKQANSAIDTDANRFDSYNELKYPTKLPGGLDWINVSPYARMRQTYYSKDNIGADEDFFRGIHYYGIELNTKFFRIFDYSGNTLGIELNRLRHVISPKINYDYIHTPTVQESKLGIFDDIDSITKKNLFTFGVENHLQTKWKQKGSAELENVDILYFYPWVEYRQNAAPEVKHFGYINSELEFRPNRWLWVESDAVFNQYQKRFKTLNADLYAQGDDKWRISLGKRYDRDISEQSTASLYYKINRKWQVGTYTRYLSYTDVFQEQEYTIYRDLHCWLLEMGYNV